MKTRMVLLILTVALASCMHEACPTYSGSKSHGTTASAKKSKAAKKGGAPFFKREKQAETD